MTPSNWKTVEGRVSRLNAIRLSKSRNLFKKLQWGYMKHRSKNIWQIWQWLDTAINRKWKCKQQKEKKEKNNNKVTSISKTRNNKQLKVVLHVRMRFDLALVLRGVLSLHDCLHAFHACHQQVFLSLHDCLYYCRFQRRQRTRGCIWWPRCSSRSPRWSSGQWSLLLKVRSP